MQNEEDRRGRYFLPYAEKKIPVAKVVSSCGRWNDVQKPGRVLFAPSLYNLRPVLLTLRV
jgi:hypothetical protein